LANTSAPVAPAADPKPAAKRETLSKAAEAYIEEMKARQAAGQISACHVRSQNERLAFALKGVDDKAIADLTDSDVTAMILRLASLPMKGKGYKNKKHKAKRISTTTAKNCLNTLRWFLVWADETDRWTAPKRTGKLFKQVRFKEESAEEVAEVPHFNLVQLKSLWKHADDRLRMWIALGLNCAFGPTELATLKRSEVRFGAQPHIQRRRQKSDVFAKWSLWPETVKLLKTQMEKSGELALLNEAGVPLIVESIERRSDSIGKSWGRLAKRAEVDGTFKLLRKTGATLIKRIAGLEVSEMMLAHIEGSEIGGAKMNRHYAGRDWDKLAEALGTMREQLVAAKVFDVEEDAAEEKSVAAAA
jgi:integrase